MLDLAVYLVTDSRQLLEAGHDPVEAVRAAVAGGVSAVQVRDKHADARDALAFVLALSASLPASVALFVNDRVDVFLAARARGARVSGVHVGQGDLPAADVRAMIGPDAVIGLTTSTPAEVADAAAHPARIGYLGVGAVHATSSKADAPPVIGVEGVGRLARAASVPAVAIGGITEGDLPALRAAGLAGAAVVSAICAAPDPRAAARRLAAAWEAAA